MRLLIFLKQCFFFLLCIFSYLTFYAQTCPTTTVCFPAGSGAGAGTYVVVPTPISLTNATIIPNPIPSTWTGQTVKAIKAACVTNGGINDTIDVWVTAYKPDSATNSNKSFSGGFTLQANGILGCLGAANQTYQYRTNFYKTGTTTPIAINVLQQVRDCDGDGDYNNDGIRDDPRCDVPLVQVSDDYIYATGFSNYTLSTPTLIYTRVAGAFTYFYSSGHENATAYSGISSIPPPTSGSALQGAVFAYLNSSQIDFYYYAGQYGGVNIDYTAQNLLIPLPCATTPIKINYFNASKQKGCNTLNWETSNAVNSNHIDVERSYNGLVFEKVTSFNSQNNSNGLTYFYNDSIHAIYSNVYYRLKLVDNSGEINYSNICLLKNTDNTSLISVYPNITTGNFTISAATQALVNTSAYLFDTNGRLVKTIPITNQQQQVNISTLINGVYILHLNDASSFKIIKQ